MFPALLNQPLENFAAPMLPHPESMHRPWGEEQFHLVFRTVYRFVEAEIRMVNKYLIKAIRGFGQPVILEVDNQSTYNRL